MEGGREGRDGRSQVRSQLTVAVVGVLIVSLSVSSSIGIFGYLGQPATLIVLEVKSSFFY